LGGQFGIVTSQLEQSQHRLAEAVLRLEAALAGTRPDAGADAGRELSAVRQAHDELRAVANEVADRLDGAIARVDEMLGESEARDAAE